MQCKSCKEIMKRDELVDLYRDFVVCKNSLKL